MYFNGRYLLKRISQDFAQRIMYTSKQAYKNICTQSKLLSEGGLLGEENPMWQNNCDGDEDPK